MLLRGGRVFAPKDLGAVDVCVVGRQIVAIGPGLPALPPVYGGEVLDVHGCTIIPGLVDVHAHLTGGGGEGGPHTRVPPVPLSSLIASGVTTVVGLLGTDATTRSLADLLAAARGLEALGITAFAYTGAYEVPPPTLTGSIRGDIVHIDRIVAVGELAISDHRSSQPTFDEFVRIAADAHVAGMMTRKAGLVHLHLGDGPRGMAMLRRAVAETELPARTFHPTHCNRNPTLWEEALDWARQGGTIDVTAFPPADDGTVSAVDALLRYHAEGLDPSRLTISSDAGGCLPDFDADGNLLRMDVGDARGLLDVVRAGLAAGLTPEQALGPVTANPAALFRFVGKGQLAAGTDGDLVVLDRHLRVRHVVASGRLLVRDGVATRGPFETPT